VFVGGAAGHCHAMALADVLALQKHITSVVD